MSLMVRARRPLALVLLAALLLPAAAMTISRGRMVSTAENRRLASPVAWPRTLAGWRALPRAIDAYLGDHFAFRDPLLAAAAKVERALGGRIARREGSAPATAARPAAPDLPLAVSGRDGQLFLTEGLLQSTGREINPARAIDYAAFVCGARDRLARRGVQVFAAIAPSPGEILRDRVPAWAGPAQARTDYDLTLEALRQCGMAPPDLRPALLAARPLGLYNRLDSHWTQRGALIAYDQIVEAMGRRSWSIDPGKLVWITIARGGGDLPRMAGLPEASEPAQVFDIKALAPDVREAPLDGLQVSDPKAARPFILETAKPGLTVLVIGDSYAARPFFADFFARSARRVAWLHLNHCAFDWSAIDRVKPDLVVITPVERYAHCDGARPLGWGS